jgi:hypothetical protein
LNQELSEKLESTKKLKESLNAIEKEIELDDKKLVMFKNQYVKVCDLVRGNFQHQKPRQEPSNNDALVQVDVPQHFIFSELMDSWYIDWTSHGKSLSTGCYSRLFQKLKKCDAFKAQDLSKWNDLKLIVPVLFAKLGTSCHAFDTLLHSKLILSKLTLSRWSVGYEGERLKAQIVTCKTTFSPDYCSQFEN